MILLAGRAVRYSELELQHTKRPLVIKTCDPVPGFHVSPREIVKGVQKQHL